MQVSRRWGGGGCSTDGLNESEVSTLTAIRHWERCVAAGSRGLSMRRRQGKGCRGRQSKERWGGAGRGSTYSNLTVSWVKQETQHEEDEEEDEEDERERRRRRKTGQVSRWD
ncbi:uncharacterized protein PADG_11492 [Paracoccidioides brasiliensis Pb18]|uniref:Uncharacterized protein n=1 Tax=Paracoccidioides brasiliensis (strain Pb18) TaxID=502780 RepID=A0A0A0HW84_PARBD|nr:uncharacterized protein PADG_11492 [Paracoccidioides brasiliensis Pb18]KGM92301.1 hypothetical protein PADG_11492 [Paracoccidioides brasiliensis Pb18]